MKIKKLKKLLSDIYYQSIYDGIDIQRGKHDMFMGNSEARKNWEKLQLDKFWIKLKMIQA